MWQATVASDHKSQLSFEQLCSQQYWKQKVTSRSRSRSRSIIALTSKNTTTTVLSAAHRGETNHQRRQKLFFITLSVQDALFYCHLEISGFSWGRYQKIKKWK